MGFLTCISRFASFFKIRSKLLDASSDLEEQLSLLIFQFVRKATSKVPFNIRCIVAYNTLYEAVVRVIWTLFYKEKNVNWADIVGSYAENTCVSSSDVDFLQRKGIVICDPRDMPLNHVRACIVHTDSKDIPTGCCWLRVYDKREETPWIFEVKDGQLDTKGYTGIFECSVEKIDGHSHYPFRNAMEKVVCYRPGFIKRHDGYSYLSCKKFSEFYSSKGLTAYDTLNNMLPNWFVHGPAFAQTYFGLFSIDVALSFNCPSSWSDCALDWVNRPRPNNWPSKEMVHKITGLGFDVVPIPSKITQTDDADFEWRISFRTAETQLVLSFNDCQRTCFIILKVIAKQFIQPKFPDEDFVSSYIMKTVMFWTIEEMNSDIWEDKRLLHCLRLCLKRLRSCINARCCPNYFLPGYNLFRTKLERMEEVGFREWLLHALGKDVTLLLECKMFKHLKHLWKQAD